MLQDNATTNNQVDTSTTTSNTVNNTTVDPNAGRASFDDFPVESIKATTNKHYNHRP